MTNMTIRPDDVFRHADNIVTRKVMDETLLVPISGELASMDNLYTLNETGDFIWQAFDGCHRLAEIADMLAQRYDAPVAMIEKDLLELAEDLIEARLLIAESAL